ncbi:MAG: PEP-CTERM sorting domain-containing protein [Cyanobacteria bacterium J06638_6]
MQAGAPPAEDVPEPSALLGIAILGMAGVATRRRRATAQ